MPSDGMLATDNMPWIGSQIWKIQHYITSTPSSLR